MNILFFIDRFTIKDGHVTYQNRILQSSAYQDAVKNGRSCYSEYGTSRSKNITDSSNTKYESESILEWIITRFILKLINHVILYEK